MAAQKAEDNKSRELIVQLIDVGYRAMAKTLHPDMGGSHDDMTAVRDELRRRVAKRPNAPLSDPLLGVKRTWGRRASMSAYDPKQNQQSKFALTHNG